MLSQTLPVRAILTTSEVETLVSLFWRFFIDKNYQGLRDLYSADAHVFGTVTERAESALTAGSRRNIEYFGEHMKLLVNVGTVAVHLVGERTAIASYPFTFSATERHPSGSTRDYEIIRQGRATQVFALDQNNNIRIVHEHLSVSHKR